MAKPVLRPTRLGTPIARLGLWLFGRWTVQAPGPDLPKHSVMLALPHTTNTDGLLLVLVTRSIGLHAHWMVKNVWCRPPIGWVTKAVGAVPVDRSKATGMVGQMAQRFADRGSFHLLVPPEGTRKRTDYWKSGFHRIALDAGVPVIPTFLDYANKRAGFGSPITMTGDPTADMDAIRAFYDDIGVESMPKHPDQFGPMRLESESGTSAQDA